MLFPHPHIKNEYLKFKDGKFLNQSNIEEKFEVLEYSKNLKGWNSDLTDIKNSHTNKNHPIDKSSVELCLHNLKKYTKQKKQTVLEVGCLNDEILKKISNYQNFDYIGSDATNEHIYSLSKKFPKVPFLVFDILQNPFNRNICDFLIMLNVLEHIEEDEKALNEAYKLLNHEGTLIIEVPAGKFLYDEYDKKLLHYRRYSSNEIKEKILNAGFKIQSETYLGFFCFPLFAIVKIFNKFFKSENIVDKQTKLSNNFFLNILFKIEMKLKWIRFPFGIRKVICAKKL